MSVPTWCVPSLKLGFESSFSFGFSSSSFFASVFASSFLSPEEELVEVSGPPPHPLPKIMTITTITRIVIRLRRGLPQSPPPDWFGVGGGGMPGTSGVLIRPGSGTGGGGPVGTSGSGLCAAPQLVQKLVVSRTSLPQFSQNLLPSSDKMVSLLSQCPTAAILGTFLNVVNILEHAQRSPDHGFDPGRVVDRVEAHKSGDVRGEYSRTRQVLDAAYGKHRASRAPIDQEPEPGRRSRRFENARGGQETVACWRLWPRVGGRGRARGRQREAGRRRLPDEVRPCGRVREHASLLTGCSRALTARPGRPQPWRRRWPSPSLETLLEAACRGFGTTGTSTGTGHGVLIAKAGLIRPLASIIITGHPRGTLMMIIFVIVSWRPATRIAIRPDLRRGPAAHSAQRG